MIGRIDGLQPRNGALPAQPAGRPHQAISDFGRALAGALERLDASQQQAEAMAVDFATGRTDDIAAVIMAGERARLSLELAVSLRNKVIEAYQEIMRLPL